MRVYVSSVQMPHGFVSKYLLGFFGKANNVSHIDIEIQRRIRIRVDSSLFSLAIFSQLR